MKPYLLQLEISGPTALWARPDTLPNPVSYVAPTFSAAQGSFEAILRWKSVNVRLTRCGRQCLRPPAARALTDERAESPVSACSPHAYVDAFHRRLEWGRWFYTPCLGWQEFVPDYVGPFRDGTAPCATENHIISATT
jgi:CRISPR-associated protein Cas5d